MLNVAEVIFFEQIRERGILETSVMKYILNLDTYELTFVDEYLSYDDSILDIKEKKVNDFIKNSSKNIVLNKLPEMPSFLPENSRIFNLSEVHGYTDIKNLGKLYQVFDEKDFLPNCLNYNLLNVAVFEKMLSSYEKMQVLKCFLGD